MTASFAGAFRAMAHNNAWANHRLLTACTALDDAADGLEGLCADLLGIVEEGAVKIDGEQADVEKRSISLARRDSAS